MPRRCDAYSNSDASNYEASWDEKEEKDEPTTVTFSSVVSRLGVSSGCTFSSGFGSPVMSESDGEVPPPPPDESDSSNYSDQSFISVGEDDSSPLKSLPNESHQPEDFGTRRSTNDCSYESYLNFEEEKFGVIGKDSKWVDRSRLNHSISHQSNQSYRSVDTAMSEKFYPISDGVSCGSKPSTLFNSLRASTIDTETSGKFFPMPEGMHCDLNSSRSFCSFPATRNDWKANRISSLFRILRIFTIRCGFDHWKHTPNVCVRDFHPFRQASLERTSRNESVHSACAKMERIILNGMKRYAFIKIKMKAGAMLERSSALHMIFRVFKGAMTQFAFALWLNHFKRLNWQLTTLKRWNRIKRRNYLMRVFCSWRAFAQRTSMRRQISFLMMIFNRWKIYTEECIDFRQKRYDALMHWASSMCMKAFISLRRHAIQSIKDKSIGSYCNHGKYSHIDFRGFKSTTSCIPLGCLRNSFSSPGSRLNEWNRDYQRPFKISYRSPKSSMIQNRTPDNGIRFSNGATSTRTFARSNDREYRHSNLFNKAARDTGFFRSDIRAQRENLINPKNESCYFRPSSSTLLYGQHYHAAKHDGKNAHLERHVHDYRPNHCSSTSTFLGGLPFLSSDPSVRSIQINEMDDYSATHNLTNYFRRDPLSRQGQDCLVENNHSSRTFSNSSGLFSYFEDENGISNPNDPSSIHNVGTTESGSHRPPPSTIHDDHTMSQSVRSIRNYHRDRLEISTLLDSMVSRVELLFHEEPHNDNWNLSPDMPNASEFESSHSSYPQYHFTQNFQ